MLIDDPQAGAAEFNGDGLSSVAEANLDGLAPRPPRLIRVKLDLRHKGYRLVNEFNNCRYYRHYPGQGARPSGEFLILGHKANP